MNHHLFTQQITITTKRNSETRCSSQNMNHRVQNQRTQSNNWKQKEHSTYDYEFPGSLSSDDDGLDSLIHTLRLGIFRQIPSGHDSGENPN